MKKILFFLTAILFLSSCSTVDSLKPFDREQAAILLQQRGSTNPAKQMVSLDLPPTNWKKTSYTPDETSSFVVLVPPHETPAYFTQSIQGRIMPYAFHSDVTAKKYAQAEIKDAKMRCAKAKATIVQQMPEYIIYRLSEFNCATNPDRKQIGKVWNGIDGVYSVRYVANTDAVTQENIKTTSKAIMGAKLIRDPRTGA